MTLIKLLFTNNATKVSIRLLFTTKVRDNHEHRTNKAKEGLKKV